ncbi:hypothetical protein LOY94_005053 [Ophidiomyces ophidiicola]|nr:hypothetical protein LOZ60_006180 [Ophidiomyces ophidiicola]KAI2136482.1 hypothetical protein LOZ27_006176 [Ophidiomyces ophidiicola]KAI2213571.1 hypothetical protein LOZ15_005072 [Ophidiomyces ophidiicola]KAI2346735.1 hypothetical protein LOY94_005053 [Ophidiomyces ophidiicola]KAI2406712.1 hypothetical protein LOY90_003565 [Ophidiomyces ophidiicola]
MSAPPQHNTSSLSDTKSIESAESALLVRYSTEEQNNSCNVSESDWSDMLTALFKSEFNAQLNSDSDELFCKESIISTVHAVQNQLLVNFLTHNISDILNVSEHDGDAASPSINKQHESGTEGVNVSNKSANIEQADKLSAQRSNKLKHCQ